ncbi:MAG: cytochrome-c oxidase, cbb3-type subunit III [Pseudotabrizicola sp.]|uniref:cytochrome-c oxidase, cbb3-type subunit III n=1 Tax=Pseudotabrizicola sp. TaxID=2939647 RepID=UPI0027320ECC|nr:cytochrome-c oxidase, cbb3-type subunit III [Pseudotabrizicola sp.]MDP2080281.1 cytochrome-c oxidase, cbb3-type subunit III [Pseudotabrizicola sp.]MDZ7575366.1 cytochrome-c oxidase, cbb3-type subunit III [Pseudotabrizicola sp.]
MSVEERDPVSGYLTTGHVWNGITELNSPVPRIVFAFMVVTHLYALVAWFLLPAWPLGQTFTKGLLGIDQKTAVAADIAAANADRADWMDALATHDFETIRADPDLMARALATAEPLFGQNCQVCHGANGIGGPGYPRLNDNIWVWGGTADEIATTLRVGINADHPDTHFAQMPAFGRDGLLTGTEISVLTDYVQTLGAGVMADDPSDGALLFQTNCAGCHGEDARGISGSGAPNLTDGDWLYGGDATNLRHGLVVGRQGQMPSWQSRLTEAEIRAMALYVEDLSGTAP